MARNTSRINKLIGRIGTRSAHQRQDIGEALIEVAMFAFEDRNTDPAINLFKAVSGGGVATAAMSKWLSTFACIHFKEDKPVLSDKRQKEASSTQTPAAHELMLKDATPWYLMDGKKDKAPNIWDGDEQIEKLKAHLLQLQTKASKNGDMKTADTVQQVYADLLATVKTKVEAETE
jgi:hypothetical protein